jgi:polysaccharide export outer membrane protein
MTINKLFPLLIILLISSCASKKDFVYFQGSEEVKTNLYFEPKLQQDDFLNIIIFGCDEESLKIFNIPPSTTNTTNRGYYVGASASQGYLINEKGEIDFPVIGKIKVGGLSRDEAADLIKTKLSVYLKDPKVSIQIQNFKITILGDVKNPGTIQVPNERITLIEALGIVGDLNITAIRKNVLILRNENGKNKEYRIDLSKKDFLNSPVYYLNQNDVIYVEANKTKINSSNVSASSSMVVAVASLLITTINVLTK